MRECETVDNRTRIYVLEDLNEYECDVISHLIASQISGDGNEAIFVGTILIDRVFSSFSHYRFGENRYFYVGKNWSDWNHRPLSVTRLSLHIEQ